MDTPNCDSLLRSLAETIADYRQNEIPSITPAHIERWLSQFESKDQPIILAEMDRLMKRFYFSNQRVKAYLRKFIGDHIVGTQKPLSVLPYTHFLCIQTRGNSQRALLEIVDEIIQEDYGLSLASCGIDGAQTYVYIDDCIYTGSKARYDLSEGEYTAAWILREAPPQCNLIIYHVGIHVEGFNYARRYVMEVARKKKLKVTWKFSFLIDNTRSLNSRVEFLWPVQPGTSLAVTSYVSRLSGLFTQRGWSTNDIYRPADIPKQETVFSSPAARNMVDQAFLKKGLQIITASRSPAESMRPLGFAKINVLGFGTLFTTYQNIANNCPLVLWWGDPKMPVTHPLGSWYPLFPRKTNNQTQENIWYN